MKKILISFIIIFIVMGIGSVSLATEEAEAKIEINLTNRVETINNRKTVILKLALGKFTQIADNATLGYEAILEYDAKIFETVEVTGLNGWTVNYAESTKRIVTDPKIGAPNTDITEIKLTAKEGVETGIPTAIKLYNILLSDGTNDFNYSREITVVFEEEQKNEESNTDNENRTNIENKDTIAKEENDKTSTSSNKMDTTISNTPLPKAGISRTIVIMIAIIIIAIICIIKYKSIQIK